jgi:hypothetical protein
MIKPYPVFCADCKFSKPEERSEWNLRCHHPIINANDSYALSNAKGETYGSDCNSERNKRGWFVNCGMSGKFWSPK